MGTLDELTKAWMAGLFDGDGFVACYKSNGKYPQYKTQAGVVNIDRQALMLFYTHYSGAIRYRKQTSVKHQLRSDWRVSGRKMREFLKDMAPYSVIKKQRIALTLEFLQGIGNNGGNGKGKGRRSLSPEEIKRRDGIIKKVKELQSHKVA